MLTDNFKTAESEVRDFAAGAGKALREQFVDGIRQLAGARVSEESVAHSDAERLGEHAVTTAVLAGTTLLIHQLPVLRDLKRTPLMTMATGAALGFMHKTDFNGGILERLERAGANAAAIGAVELGLTGIKKFPRATRLVPVITAAKTAKELVNGFDPVLTAGEQARRAQLEPEVNKLWREYQTHEIRTPLPLGYESRHDFPKPDPGTFNASWMSARNLRHYSYNLAIPPEELHQGSRILDLGAGASQNLARDCDLAKLDSTVVSVDPRLARDAAQDVFSGLFEGVGGTSSRERFYGRKMPQPNTLAADATRLPFADGSFDRVYAHYSVPMYFNGTTEAGADTAKITQSLAEVKRVLNNGGIARIFPIPDRQVETVQNTLKELGFKPYPHDTPTHLWPNGTYQFTQKNPYDPRWETFDSVYPRGYRAPVERLLVLRK